MGYSKIFGAQVSLLKGNIITVEVDTSRGLHAFSIVGLPDKAVEEARDRVSAAIKNSGFESPKSKNQKVVVSLAPADLKKEGAGLDLPIALAYLLAEGEVDFDINKKLFVGELSLDGSIRSIKGALSVTRKAKEKGFEEIFLPEENAKEASLIDGIKIFGAGNLRSVVEHLDKNSKSKIKQSNKSTIPHASKDPEIDLADIKGQESAKRALEISAAGGHNIAFYGPPGTGKTMLARALAGVLPSLSFDEILEVTEIHSASGVLSGSFVIERPFRSPHHTSSYVSLVGGGANVKPGEITLAHRGVLFLDEFPEFDQKSLEALRQPLEERYVSVSRAKGSAKFPASFILVAAMNPCPCGNFGVKGKPCICTPMQISRYKRKISGPIIDRIDIWTEVSRVDHDKLTEESKTKESIKVRDRVLKARDIQSDRFKKNNRNISTNSEMNARDMTVLLDITQDAKESLNKAAKTFNLSARGYHKILKIAQTIADLDHKKEITRDHILEAISYRPKAEV